MNRLSQLTIHEKRAIKIWEGGWDHSGPMAYPIELDLCTGLEKIGARYCLDFGLRPCVVMPEDWKGIGDIHE